MDMPRTQNLEQAVDRPSSRRCRKTDPKQRQCPPESWAPSVSARLICTLLELRDGVYSLFGVLATDDFAPYAFT